MVKISAVIITFNEEKKLARCIESVMPVADEIIVLDSYSTDNTEKIAREAGALFYQQSFLGYKEQKNAAIKFASMDYILSLDADEALSPELINSILAEKNKLPSDNRGLMFQAYSMNRICFFCDRFIHHGLWYPDKKVRLFNKHYATWGGMNPHDKIILKEGTKVCHLHGNLLHYSFNSKDELPKRNEELSTVAALALFQKNPGRSRFKIVFNPVWRFFKSYILKLGFLDGYYGFFIAKHSAYQSYLKYKKLNLLYKQKKNELASADL